VAPRSEDPKLIIHVINLELVQPIFSWYVKFMNVTDRWMDDLRLQYCILHCVRRVVKSI